MDFKPYVIKEIIEESEDVKTFKLLGLGGEVPKYQAGHFFLIRLPDESGKLIHRPYSAASAPWEDRLWFCVKNKGTFPQLLWKLKEEDRVEIDGPYGLFLLNPSDTERIFIGGGVGISALRGMVLQSIREGKRSHLFHSAKTASGLVYSSEFMKLEKESPLFKFHPTITGEVPSGWSGGTGRIGVEMVKRAVGSLDGKSFYLCGSKEMASSLAAALEAEGVPKEKIRKDEWG